ncbi:MAG: RagB/SusD family nutrient uptake outer membrane protein [Bacteroidales bacterium]|nr:RagB/SusD family nutrient uptake outer membrane protein [Bacteroidales bacterium]
MKLNRIIPVLFAGILLVACTDMNTVQPAGGTLLAKQLQETNEAVPSRAAASFAGLFNPIGLPNYYGYETPDDFGVLMMLFCNDLESADATASDNNYNWFSVCGEYSSRSANYRNPVIRYRAPYSIVSSVNDFLAGFGDEVTNQESLYMIAQARALRAYAYLLMAPAFQFVQGPNGFNADLPAVPICSPDVEDVTHNPRAPLGDIYNIIIEDLTAAIDGLKDYDRPSKKYLDQSVCYGLRARANLDMGKYAEAAADAEEAAKGYTPASIAEVSTPTFQDISEHNWIWGFDMNADLAKRFRYATTSSWLRSFSGWAYAAGTATYTCINKILYDKIPATDVRKGWWLDENLYSPLLDGLTWDAGENGSASGQAIADFEYDDKLAFVPYTNVKFGCTPIGTNDNAEDMPLMRVEEMLLIQAEAYAKSGNTAKATQILEDFVKTYRDPSYTVTAGGRSLADEIWFQRRVELWGEGFAILDTKRLQKPMVRFLSTAESTNVSPAFRFNMAADDGWLLMRFTNSEMNTNFSIVDNTDGTLPKMDQNPDLRDGVTN